MARRGPVEPTREVAKNRTRMDAAEMNSAQQVSCSARRARDWEGQDRRRAPPSGALRAGCRYDVCETLGSSGYNRQRLLDANFWSPLNAQQELGSTPETGTVPGEGDSTSDN